MLAQFCLAKGVERAQPDEGTSGLRPGAHKHRAGTAFSFILSNGQKFPRGILFSQALFIQAVMEIVPEPNDSCRKHIPGTALLEKFCS